MKAIEALGKTEQEIRDAILRETLHYMEAMEEAEDDIMGNKEDSIPHKVGLRTLQRYEGKFHRNIELLKVLKGGE